MEEGLRAVAGRAPRDLLLARGQKEATRLRGEVERLEKKLANEQFVAKAAPDVVAKERAKLAGYLNEYQRVTKAVADLERP